MKKEGSFIPIQAYIVILIGIVFIYLGYLVFFRKALGVLDLYLKAGITVEDERTVKFFGSIIFIIGAIVISLPFMLGKENMNL